MASFEQLLAALLAPDNAIRGQGEAEFTKLKGSPDDCVDALLQVVVSQTSASELRQLASVLLRRVILVDDVSLWTQLTEPTQTKLKQTVLGFLRVPGIPDRIRRLISDVAGELGVKLVEEVGTSCTYHNRLCHVIVPRALVGSLARATSVHVRPC